MPTITTTATVTPENVLLPQDVKQVILNQFELTPRRAAAISSIFDNTFVKQRYSVFSLAHLARTRPFRQVMQEYEEQTIKLGTQVITACLEQAKLRPEDIDFLITTSSTGVMTPALDAYLINALRFRPNVRHLPITQLACAAGAVALARAWEFLHTFPTARVLVAAVEVPTLVAQHRDSSLANLVSYALFGDGAAAALLTNCAGSGMHILGTESYLFPDSTHVVRHDLRDEGFFVTLGKQLPELIRGHIKPLVTNFLADYNLTLEQLSFVAFHTGGQKILAYVEQELAFDQKLMQPSWNVLRKYGNLLSASVLFVLHEWLTAYALAEGSYGLLVAFGPGLTAELLLLRTS